MCDSGSPKTNSILSIYPATRVHRLCGVKHLIPTIGGVCTFSTFVLIMIVTVGVIAFGASIVTYRSLRKTRPVGVVSPLVTTVSSLCGECLKSTSSNDQPGALDAVE